MGVRRLFRVKHLLVLAAFLGVFSVGRLAWAACSTSGGVTCCGNVYKSEAGFCCWSVGCSDGTSSGGCSACVLTKNQDSKQKNRMQEKDTTVLVARLLVKDRELSRALNSIR